jgi:dipeptidyl aminopeptidase/acylaminoacyl peptidase
VPIQIYAHKIRDINQEAMYKNRTTYTENSPIRVLYLKIIVFLFFILPVVTCPCWGQVVQKKQLDPSDYPLWGELRLDNVSSNAKWVSYKISYESGLDTLFVRNTTNKKSYVFPLGKQATFMEKDWFSCLLDRNLKVVHLPSGKQQTITGVSQYQYSSVKNQLLVLVGSTLADSTLLIQSPEGIPIKKIHGVTQFSVSPNGKEVVYCTVTNNKNSVGLLNLEKVNQTKWLILDSENNFHNFSWQKQGKALAFFENPDRFKEHNKIYYYNFEDNKLSHLDPAAAVEFPNNTYAVDTYKLSISDDAQRVFFAIKTQPALAESKQDSIVEVWNGNDKWIYPMEQKWGQFQKKAKLALWTPMSHSFKPIATNELPKLMLSGNQKYAILSNPKEYEPQFEYEGPRDFYIMDLATGEKNNILKKFSSSTTDLLPSPCGKYIAYFSENNWWVYNIKSKTHVNLTGNIQTQFKGKVNLLYKDTAYGNPGWTTDDQEILVYDQYDLWAIKPDGTSFKKLTHGRELQIRYRLADILNKSAVTINYDGRLSGTIDLEKDLFLRGEGNDGQTGYFKWKMDSGEKAIIYGQSDIDQFAYTANKQVFFYREQRFGLSPRLMCKESFSAAKQIFQSNPQQIKYNWGKAELMEYQNSNKKNLKGVLFYPAAYDPQKKYPMIVHIYEKQSEALHRYVNPTSLTEDGFNTTAFTTQDYFVFYPDIVHENENPGVSAADCVIAATTKVLGTGMINRDKVGLIGHSFGGYETAFIISQTGLFATAVAGAAVTDLNSFYLTVGWNSGKPDMWRFQSEQWRMGKTPYEDPQAYRRNSTIAWVDKINTPLLLWTGKKDRQVDWHQSIEGYLALRRLEKKNIMLLYPQEGHVILNPTNQQDLFKRVQQWFGYYLKDELPPLWISQGIQ